jgi:hypothetical protein
MRDLPLAAALLPKCENHKEIAVAHQLGENNQVGASALFQFFFEKFKSMSR